MVDVDRRVKRHSWINSFPVVPVDIHGNVVVDRGDLLFLDSDNKLRNRGVSVADHYAYPFGKISGTTLTLASNITLAKTHFIGVATSPSDSGVTEQIGVYAGGLFRYPMKNARKVHFGYYALPCGSGVTLYNQKLNLSATSANMIAKICCGGDLTTTVEVQISSIIQPMAALDDN